MLSTVTIVISLLLFLCYNSIQESNRTMENVNGIRISTFNVHGFSTCKPFLYNLLSTVDILGISEHWVYNAGLCNEMSTFHPDFECLSLCAKRVFKIGRASGGIAIFWRKSLNHCIQISDINLHFDVNHVLHKRICGIELTMQGNSEKLCIFNVYLPSKDNDNGIAYSNALDIIDNIIETNDMHQRCIIIGDLNGDPRALNSDNPQSQGSLLSEFTHRNEMNSVSSIHTLKGPRYTYTGYNGTVSCIDHILIPHNMNSQIVEVSHIENPVNTSDHLPVRVILELKCNFQNSENIMQSSKLAWNKVSKDFINDNYFPLVESLFKRLNEEKSIDNDNTFDKRKFSPSEIEEFMESITKNFNSAANLSIPKIRFRKKNGKPYWKCNPLLPQITKDKKIAYDNWCAAGKPRESNNVLWIKMKESKKALRKALRQAE
ncbi:unnamed protein product, partial [Owenia fusiformis]